MDSRAGAGPVAKGRGRRVASGPQVIASTGIGTASAFSTASVPVAGSCHSRAVTVSPGAAVPSVVEYQCASCAVQVIGVGPSLRIHSSTEARSVVPARVVA